MEELISIIIPTFRGSEKIGRTLDGIRQQTCKNYEVIVVDDNGAGSDEQKKTADVVSRYPDVIYLAHPENRNGSAARNTGIRASHGQYLAFLDDDDVWRPDKLAVQLSRFRELDAGWGLVYSPYILVETEEDARLVDQRKEGMVLYEFLVEDVHIACSTIMVRREAVEHVKGFDESFRRHQDWEFIARIAAEYKVACAPGTVVMKYAIRRNSPKELETLIRNRLYYLRKMEPVIALLPPEQRRRVSDYHHAFLAKECCRRGKLLQCAAWLGKTGCPLCEAGKLTGDIARYIVRKSRKTPVREILRQFEQTGLITSD